MTADERHSPLEGSASTTGADPGSAPVARKRRVLRRLLISLGVLSLVLALLVGGGFWFLTNRYGGNIDRVANAFAGLDEGARPAPATPVEHTGEPPVTFLLVGSDTRGHTADGEDPDGRSDAIMIARFSGDRRHAQLISIPRDSWVDIPGHGKNKINAAFSFGGPKLLIQTVEGVTGLRVDDYVEIGFGGFASIIDSVGGVQMCLPKAMKDAKAHINLPKGCQQLDGTTALGYVRARYSDPLGDLGRVQRQRQMIGAVASKGVSPATFLNPFRYYKLSTASADALTVDKDTGPIDLAHFALGMKAVAGGGGGVTLTVPISNNSLHTTAGLAVKWDTTKAKALFNALKEDRTSGLTTK
jgi:LCP family protein required for cell wall assembly